MHEDLLMAISSVNIFLGKITGVLYSRGGKMKNGGSERTKILDLPLPVVYNG